MFRLRLGCVRSFITAVLWTELFKVIFLSAGLMVYDQESVHILAMTADILKMGIGK